MIDGWIIDRVQQERKERGGDRHRTPLYAPRPVPPEVLQQQEAPTEPHKPQRGVVEDLDKEFLI